MECICRCCGHQRQSYVRRLCKLCYEKLKKQERRNSPLFDPEMLYPRVCTVPHCGSYVVKGNPGLPMCQEHHELFYHTTGYFAEYGCKCSLNPAANLD